VEKLKTEQEVNVYSTVLRARQTRPQFSSNLVNLFGFCFLIISFTLLKAKIVIFIVRNYL